MRLNPFCRIKLERARELRKRGAYTEAEEELREAMEEQPDHPDLKLGLAMVFVKEKRHADAITLAQEVLQDNPSHPQALYVMGEVAFQESRLESALEYFQRAAHSDHRPYLKMRIVRTLVKMRRYEKALDVLDNELLRDTDNLTYLKEKAILLNRMGRSREALEIYKKLREGLPDDPFVRKEAIRLSGLDKAPQDTISELEAVVRMPSYENDAQLRALLAQKLKQAGKLQDAAQWFLKAFEIEPSNPFFVKQAGFCYYEMGRLDEAADALGQALMHDPDDFYVSRTLDKIHSTRNTLQDYIVLLEDILARHPGKRPIMGKIRSLRKRLDRVPEKDAPNSVSQGQSKDEEH